MKIKLLIGVLLIGTGCSAVLDLDGDEPAEVDARVVDSTVTDQGRDVDRGMVPIDRGLDQQLRDVGRPAPDGGRSDMALRPDVGGCYDPDGDGYGRGCALGDDCAPNERTVHPGARERCNGYDDDCDGQTDEEFPELGEECTAGVGGCQAAGQVMCTGEYTTGCSAGGAEPEDEVCDRIDNDCDSLIDEEVGGCCERGAQRECGASVGQCEPGTQTCDEAGQWGACLDLIGPMAEVCDAIDNDCDGSTDEGTLNACGACDAVPVEVCDNMDNDCDGRTDEGMLNACGACGAAPAEVCNGRDEDCDGRVDEGVTNACGACGDVPTEECNQQDDDCDGRVDEGVSNACGECGVVPVEQCNQVDDDCDNRIDENAQGTGGGCSGGVGACQRNGVMTCSDGAISCAVNIGAASPEVCNTIDDDCDGQTDEGHVCTELCNGRDDDQDGRVDEGVLNVCGECGAVPSERCDGVDNDCDGATDEGLLNQCGACGVVPAEVCDGQDNDCDNATDEGFANLGQPCSVGVGECLATGTNRCAANGRGVECSARVSSSEAEICDGLDNDCDGSPDEGLFNACGHCGPEPFESCDGRDNDCDGGIDEDFDLMIDPFNCGACGNRCGAAVAADHPVDPREPAPARLPGVWVCEGGRCVLEDLCGGEPECQ